MTRYRFPVYGLSLLLAFSALTAPAKAKVVLEEVLSEKTFLFAKAENIKQLKKIFSDHPLFAVWHDEEVKKFFAPLQESWEKEGVVKLWMEKLDLDDQRLQEIFPGQVGFAVRKFIPPEEVGKEPEINFALLADYDGDLETVKKIINGAHEEVDTEPPFVEKEFLGHTLYLKEVEDEQGDPHFTYGWAIMKGVLVIATPVDLLREILSSIEKEDNPNSLAKNATFRKVKDRSEGAELLLYVNVEPIVTLLHKELEKTDASSDPVNNLGLTPSGIVKALALEVIEGFYLAISFREEEAALDAGLFYTENRGLVSLLAYQKGDLPRAPFIPKDVLIASAYLFSLEEFWKNLQEIVFRVSPLLAGIYMGYIEHLKAEAKVDFEASVIQNFKDEFVSYTGFGPKKENGLERGSFDDLTTVYAFSFKDRQGLELALEALKAQLGGGTPLFEEREYLGTTIFTPKMSGPPSGAENADETFAYALTEKYLFLCLGSTTLLEATLSRLHKGGDSFWEKEGLEEAIDRLPPQASALDYQDLGALLDLFFVFLAQTQEESLKSDPNSRYCDPAALPRPNRFPYFYIGKVYREEDGLFNRALFLKKSE